MKKTDIFDRLDNVIGNYQEGVAKEHDVVMMAYEVNKYLFDFPHPHDVLKYDTKKHELEQQVSDMAMEITRLKNRISILEEIRAVQFNANERIMSLDNLLELTAQNHQNNSTLPDH
jgi:hypothetical protein